MNIVASGKESTKRNGGLLSPSDVQELYTIPVTTLEKWRSLKIGPPYHKLGKHIRYQAKDIEQWIESRKILTTP